jgi:hypothetical protein
MKQALFLIVFAVAGALAAHCANAAVQISGPIPTTVTNGDPYVASAGDVLNLSKNGAPATLYTITAAMASAGAYAFVDTTSSNCVKDKWAASYTSVGSGLTSAVVTGTVTTIDGVGCAVKFAPGLTIK